MTRRDPVIAALLSANEARLRLLLTLVLLARVAHSDPVTEQPGRRAPTASVVPRRAGGRLGRGQPTRPPRAC